MAEQELYFLVECGLPGSDGAKILKRRLEVERAWSYTVEMWDWFVRLHPEGQVVGPDSAYLIADGAGWRGDADKFCAAMVAAGYLAAIPEGFRVKGWKDWAGYHLEVRAKEREKKRNQRRPRVHPRDVPGTSPGQASKKTASEVSVPGTPLPSLVSDLKSTEGVQGEGRPKPRLRYVSPIVPDPAPNTTAVLAALLDQGIDAAPPSAKQEARVEAAIVAAGIPAAIDRLVAVYADPNAQRPLTYHVDAIRGTKKPALTHGDLGAEITPWPQRLTDEERRRARAELAALHPELADAPLGITGVPDRHPVEAIRDLNERWRRVAEERT